MRLCKGMEAALQSRITRLFDSEKLLRKGAAASIAFSTSRIQLKKMIEMLEKAEKQAEMAKES